MDCMKKSDKFSQERRLVDFDRPPRCIFPYSITQTPQEISSVLHSGEILAIQSTPIRTQVLSKNVSECGISCSRLFENAKSEIGYLPGRLVFVECNKKQCFDRHRSNAQPLGSISPLFCTDIFPVPTPEGHSIVLAPHQPLNCLNLHASSFCVTFRHDAGKSSLTFLEKVRELLSASWLV